MDLPRSSQGAFAKQQRGASPALLLAEVGVFAITRVVAPRSLRVMKVVSIASVSGVVPCARVLALATVVSLAAAGGDDDTAAAEVVPADRANEVLLRGSRQATRVVPSRGSRPAAVVPRWSCRWTRSIRRSAYAPALREVNDRRASQVMAAPAVVLAGVGPRHVAVARVLPFERVVPALRRGGGEQRRPWSP